MCVLMKRRKFSVLIKKKICFTHQREKRNIYMWKKLKLHLSINHMEGSKISSFNHLYRMMMGCIGLRKRKKPEKQSTFRLSAIIFLFIFLLFILFYL